MSKSKFQIHEFDNGIYPIYLWVIYNGGMDDVEREFELTDPDDSWDEHLFECSDAVTISNLKRKSDPEKVGTAVWLSRRNISSKIMAHEAVHVATNIFLAIGAQHQADNEEPYAYLVGWATGCIDTVCKGKFTIEK